jgi:hypothetical protein
VGFYPLNEGAGNVAYDLSESGVDGVFAGTPLPSPIVDRFGKSIYFNNTTAQCIDISPDPLNSLTAFSVTGWVNPLTTDIGLVQSWQAGADQILIRDNGSTGLQFYTYTSGQVGGNILTYTLNEWQHVVFTYDGTTMRAYRNGVVSATTYAQTGAMNSVARLRIGGGTVSENPTNGNIGDVRIYNRAISAEEIADLYYNPNGIYLPQRRAVFYSLGGATSGAGSSVSIATVTVIGAATVDGAASSTGAAVATAIGAVTTDGTASSAGVATTSATSTTATTGAGSSAGTATTSAIGAAIGDGTYGVSGVAVTSATGAATTDGAASSIGVATVSMIVTAIVDATATAGGTATVSTIGVTIVDGTYDASGMATTSAIGMVIAGVMIRRPYVTQPQTLTRIDPNSRQTQGLIGFYPLNEGGGNVAYDLSESGINGAFVGTPLPAPTVDQFGKSLYFDNTLGQYIKLAPSPLNGLTAFSISCWVNPITTNIGLAIYWEGAAADQIIIRATTSMAQFYIYNATQVGGDILSYTLGEWQQLVFTYDGATMRAYRNASVSATTYAQTGALITVPELHLCGYSSTGNQMNGNIGDVRIYNRTLSDEEILEFYRNPNDIYLPQRHAVFYSLGATISGVGSSVGVAVVTGTGAIASTPGVYNISGTAVASATGAATIDGTASSVGIATITATGAATVDGICNATGVATTSAIGIAISDGTATAVGTAVTSTIGAPIVDGTYNASGAATTSAISAAVATGTASSAGTAVTSTIGVAISDGIGTASGIAVVSATGAATIDGVASSIAIATVTATGAATADGVYNATGVATTTGVATLPSGSGAGSAIGVATVTAIGAATMDGAASSIAAATTSAVGKVIANSTYIATGVAIVTAIGVTSSNLSIGSASGIGVAAAIGAAIVNGTVSSIGVSAVNGISTTAANDVIVPLRSIVGLTATINSLLRSVA